MNEMEGRGGRWKQKEHLGRIFIHLYDKHLVSTNHVPYIFVNAGYRGAQAGRAFCLPINYIRVEKDKLEYENQIITIIISGIY